MKNHLGSAKVTEALRRLENITLTTSFSGCGLAELNVEALAAVVDVTVNLGPALDWDKHCQAVLKARWPQRCIFSDIEDVVKGFKKSSRRKPPSCTGLRPAWCYTHQKYCDPQGQTQGKENLSMEVAGPCCPPWSAFGKGKGVNDPRYKSHEACFLLNFILFIFKKYRYYNRKTSYMSSVGWTHFWVVVFPCFPARCSLQSSEPKSPTSLSSRMWNDIHLSFSLLHWETFTTTWNLVWTHVMTLLFP